MQTTGVEEVTHYSGDGDTGGAWWKSARARGVVETLRLVRSPLVFTTTGDVLVGFFALIIIGPDWHIHARWWYVLGLAALVSALLYAFGMTTNDLADRERDRALHPQRPLPSGRLSLPYARAVAWVTSLTACGLAFGAGVLPGVHVVTMIALILLYNRYAKGHAEAGAAVMGAIRAANVLLGLQFAATLGGRWTAASLHGSAFLPVVAAFAYIALTTYLSTAEEQDRKGKVRVVVSLAAILGGLLWLKAVHLSVTADPLVPLIILVLWRLIVALLEPTRETTGQTVWFLLLGLFAIDAHFLFHANQPPLGAFVLALLVPALALGRVLRLRS